MAMQLKQNNVLNKCNFIFRQNVACDEAERTSSGRLFQSCGCAVKNERSLKEIQRR